MPSVLKCPSDQCLTCPLRCHRKQESPVAPKDALSMLFESCSFELDNETINVADALGRVTAEEIRTKFTQPPVAGAHHDGIAVNHAAVTEIIDRGESFVPRSMYTPVGMDDPIPAPFDTVIPYEKFSFTEGGAEITALPGKGGGVLPAGNMFKEGELIAPEGFKLNSGNLFILRFSGNEEVLVKKKPRAIIIPTGKDICPPGAYESGKFIESNGLLFSSLISVGGGEAVIMPPVRNDSNEIENAIRSLDGDWDMLILIGGAGRGQEKYRDYTIRAVERLGRIICWGTGAGPGGKSQFFAEIGGKPVIGMPGPGHACITQAENYFPPILEHFLKCSTWPYPEIMAKLSDKFPAGARPGFCPHVRIAWEEDGPVIYPIKMGDNPSCFKEGNAILLSDTAVPAGGYARCRLVYDEPQARLLGSTS